MAASSIGIIVALLILPAIAQDSASGTSSDPADPGAVSVWALTRHTLRAVDSQTGGYGASIPLPQPGNAVVVDPRDDSLWVLGHRRLYQFDRDTSLLREIDVRALAKGIGDPTHLVLDPADNGLWIAAKKILVRVDRSGTKLAEWHPPDKIEAHGFALDRSLWVLTKKQLVRLSPQADVLTAIDLKGLLRDAAHVAVDSLRGRLWLAGKRELLQLDIADPASPPRAVPLPPPARGKKRAKIESIVVDPFDGNLWVTDKDEILRYDAALNLQSRIDLKAHGVKKVGDAAFEPHTRSLWLAGQKTVLQIQGDAVVFKVGPDSKIEALGVRPAFVAPTATLLEPPDGVITNNPVPAFRVALGAACSGRPCNPGAAYFGGFALELRLDQEPIARAFTIAGNIASYVPPERLAEGSHRFAISATDPFGRAVERIEGEFRIDTVPPAFSGVTPPHEAVVTAERVTISGQVDDPGAVVTLQTPSGTTLTASDPLSFGFDVSLAPGANDFTLTARDPPGNVATLPLTLVYEPAAGVAVTQPLPGSSVVGNSMAVSGTFSGEPNTGITVNGVVASTFGNRFFANNVPLAPGTNTMVVVARTTDGEVERQELEVTASGESLVGIERVTPRAAVIETIAGTGVRGFGGDNGPATEASFDFPSDLAIGHEGGIYVADTRNRRVRRISPDGTIATIAGTGANAHAGDGGPAREASFRWVGDLAVAPDGGIYLNDDTRIRRIDPTGTITTIAGSSFGFSGDGGPAIDARFGGYLGLALASDGTLYVADTQNNRVRKIDPSGIVNTIAGGSPGYRGDGGPAIDAQLDVPAAVALAPDASLYVADANNYVVRRIGTDGIISTVVGDGTYGSGGDGGPATAAQLRWPGDLAFDALGNLYISDYDDASVRRVDTQGIITTVAGTGTRGYAGDGGPPLEAQFAGPAGIAIAPDGALYVVDSANHRVRAFNASLPSGELLPFSVAFRVINNTGKRLDTIAADYDGDGAVDAMVSFEQAVLQHRYPEPGVYIADFTITDEDGAVYNVSYIVVVTDFAASDAMLRGVYSAMLDRLRAGNIDGALNAVTGGVRSKYRSVFTALQPDLAAVVDQLGTLGAGAIGDELAEYVLVRDQPDGTPRAFLIYFLRSADGVWRIDGM